MRLRQLEGSGAATLAEALARMARIDTAHEARMRAEEEKTRAALMAAGKEEGGATPLRKAAAYGRNDLVTLKKGDETQTLKFKKAERLIAE